MDINTHSSDKIASNKGNSLRFELELTPISERTKEFSYAQLVSGISEQGNNETPSLDPLKDNEQAALAKIAKRFEEKYGPTKRKRLIHESDLIDRGYGYDPSDSFVDDSELYEDYVPPQLDTKCGGFYINTGVLEFKTLEDEDNEEMDFVLKKKLVAKKHTTHAGNLAKHKAKLVLQKAQKKAPVVGQRVGSSSVIVKQAALKTKDSGEKKLTKNQLLSTEPREACIPVGIGDIAVSVPLFKASSSPSSDCIETSNAVSATPPVGQEQEGSKSPPLLPSNLPLEIQSKISSLEESIVKEQQVADGKLSNKARAGYDDQFVDIELACKKITVKERTAVFEYLSSKVGISRQTILKRVKLILRKREGGALEGPLQRLKEALAGSMAEQLAQYEEEIKNRADLITAVDKLEQEEDSKMDDMFEDAGSSVPIDGSKPKRLPRKRYKWTEDIRKLLCEVVRLKVESEEVVNRIRVSNGEELIMQFLEEKVRPLWPKGWMQKGILYKVSECAHRHFTSPQLKKSVLTGVSIELPATPLSASPAPVLLTTSTTPSTSLSTSCSTSRSFSATIFNTNIKKALSTMEGDTAVTTPPVPAVTTPLVSAVTTPPIRIPSVKPHGPSVSLPGSVVGRGRQDQYAPPLTQHGTSLAQLQSPTSQQGSLLTSLSQPVPPLTLSSQHGNMRTIQQQSPVTSAGCGQKTTVGPSNGSGPLLQTLKRSNKTASLVSPVSRQSPATGIPASLALQLQQAGIHPSVLTSMASRLQQNSNMKPSVGSSVASTAFLNALSSGGAPFSLSTALQFTRNSPVPLSHAASPSHMTIAQTASPSHMTIAQTASPSHMTIAQTASPSHMTIAQTASPSHMTIAHIASPSHMTIAQTASPSHMTIAQTASPSHMTIAQTASPSHMTIAQTASPSHMTTVYTASPSHMTTVYTASPSHMTTVYTASPSHMTIAHTASPTIAHATEVSLGPSHQRLLTLSRNSGNKAMTRPDGRETLPHSTSISADRPSPPVNGQPSSSPLKQTTMPQISGGNADQ
ncbi:hypothetical protein EMCRGX_G034088 [Ephydatia muelleri]